MSRLIDAPVRVITHRDGSPARFFWNRRWFAVEVDEVWPLTGRWWENEPERLFYRVRAGSSLFELYADAPGKWRLYKVYD